MSEAAYYQTEALRFLKWAENRPAGGVRQHAASGNMRCFLLSRLMPPGSRLRVGGPPKFIRLSRKPSQSVIDKSLEAMRHELAGEDLSSGCL